jgi:hypothetical protein
VQLLALALVRHPPLVTGAARFARAAERRPMGQRGPLLWREVLVHEI